MPIPDVQIESVIVNVHVSEKSSQFFYNGDPVVTIDVLPGRQALIRLLLETSAGPPVRLLTNPVNWFSDPTRPGYGPIETPSRFQVRRESDTLCTIFDYNPGDREESFYFKLSVQFGEAIVTSPEPTIVNRKTD